jgi:hypothetical protein
MAHDGPNIALEYGKHSVRPASRLPLALEMFDSKAITIEEIHAAHDTLVSCGLLTVPALEQISYILWNEETGSEFGQERG